MGVRYRHLMNTARLMIFTCIFMFLLTALSGVAVADPPEPVVQYHLDEQNNQILTDSSGNHLDGEMGSASQTEGIIGNALHYYTDYDYSTIPDDPLLRPASLTVMFWLKPIEFRDCGIIIKRNGFTGTECNWQVEMLSTGNLRLAYYSGGWQTLVTPEVSLTLIEWNHVAVTFDSGLGRIYINGHLEAEMEDMPPLNTNYTGNVSIGRGWGGHMRADIDEISIYSAALTQEQVAGAMILPEVDIQTLTSSQKQLCWVAVFITLPIIGFGLFALIKPGKVVEMDIGKNSVVVVANLVLLGFVFFIIATFTYESWAPESLHSFFEFILESLVPVLMFILGIIAIGGMWVRAVLAGYSPSKVKASRPPPETVSSSMELNERRSSTSPTGKEYIWKRKKK